MKAFRNGVFFKVSSPLLAVFHDVFFIIPQWPRFAQASADLSRLRGQKTSALSGSAGLARGSGQTEEDEDLVAV